MTSTLTCLPFAYFLFPLFRHQWLSKPDDVHAPHKAGYAINYDKFQFITINGAGHMVPQYQPNFALTMFKKFLKNEQF